MQDIGLDDTEAEPPAQSGTEFIDILAANTPRDTYGEITPPSHRPHEAESAGIPTPPSGMSMQPTLPTPLQTPKPCTNQTSGQETSYKVATALPELELVEKACTTTVGADLDPTNILESRTCSQQVAYLADIEEPMQMMGVHSAFAAGQQHRCQKLHHDKLPQAPVMWADIRTHQFSMDFKNAAMKEYDGLVHWGVFQPVSCWNTSSKPLPLKWVFTYKFDTDGFLQKFKARICICGDLQRRSSYEDNYAATLAAKTFQALMAIMVVFDLEAHQFDAVSAFTNSKLDETVYCKYPEGFHQLGKCLFLLRALYGLRRSPLLWLREFSVTLQELQLRMVPEVECLFISKWLVIFFFMDDIVALFKPQHQPKFTEFMTRLTSKYELRDLGELKWFLGIHVI